MATKTSNFEFEKPDVNDFYDIEVQNRNWDKVDQELKKVTYGTEELIEGESELLTGTFYFVYE